MYMVRRRYMFYIWVKEQHRPNSRDIVDMKREQPFIFLRSGILAKCALWLAASRSGFLRSGPLSRIPDRSRHQMRFQNDFSVFGMTLTVFDIRQCIWMVFLKLFCTRRATIKAFLVYTSVLHTFSTRKRQQKNKYVISRPWSVHIERNFALSLDCTDLAETAWPVHSRPRAKLFSIQTSRPWNNLYISDVPCNDLR